MEACALCGGFSRETVIDFHHVRKRQRVSLHVPLCETCGNRIEKHLKRAIPKRLMEISELAPASAGSPFAPAASPAG